jgi:hypothetical protein
VALLLVSLLPPSPRALQQSLPMASLRPFLPAWQQRALLLRLLPAQPLLLLALPHCL